MRIAGSMTLVLVLACGFALSTACSTTVPPTTTFEPYERLEPGAAIYVTANTQRARIITSLQSAGIATTGAAKNGTYTLKATVGKKRGTSSECGTTNNVVYDLRGADGRVLVIKGRGQTGSCQPNIFDDMSKKLSEYW